MKKILINILFTFLIVFVIFLIFINISLEKVEKVKPVEYKEMIQEEKLKDELKENIELNASNYGISLRSIWITNGNYYIYIDHYDSQSFYPINDESKDQLANYMHHYALYPNIYFRVVYIDETDTHGYNYKEVRLKENELNFEGEVYEVKITSSSITQEDIIDENQQLNLEGIEIKPYSHIFEKHDHQNVENEEYGDLSKYHSYDELLIDFPELTEDDAYEIFEAYQNRDQS